MLNSVTNFLYVMHAFVKPKGQSIQFNVVHKINVTTCGVLIS